MEIGGDDDGLLHEVYFPNRGCLRVFA